MDSAAPVEILVYSKLHICQHEGLVLQAMMLAAHVSLVPTSRAASESTVQLICSKSLELCQSCICLLQWVV